MFNAMGYRCGYVGVPKSHPLYGKSCDDYLDIKKADIDGREISGVFPFLIALMDEDDRVRIDAYFYCHGGITFANGGKNSNYPIDSDLWWFGFDCGHCGDGRELDFAGIRFPKYRNTILRQLEVEKAFEFEDPVRTEEYVAEECKKLAEQLKEFEEGEETK